MATTLLNYPSNNQAMTCSLNSLASSATAGRQAVSVDNTVNKYLDYLVSIKVKTSSSALANDKAVYVWVAGSVDGGANFTDGLTVVSNATTDAAFTRTDPPNLILLGVVSTPAISTVYQSGPWSVAQAFGGVIPDKWTAFVQNFNGQALDPSAGGSLWYESVDSTTA